ncbi:MAG TPA: hypothetical protein VGN56_00350 [Candidatus Paceibacterota bacterium]|jgi:hypothetical protein|nr:hypothetical protein [Candidatus Paceibacterota bacterium]
MRLAKGTTRFVILARRHAIKIARPRITHMLKRILSIPVRWKVTADRRVLFQSGEAVTGHGVAARLRHFFLSGLAANRQEYRLSREHPELPIAPVHGLYLFGIVLVMARGERVEERASERFRAPYHATADLHSAAHVCRFSDRLLFVDYGHPDVPSAFGLS